MSQLTPLQISSCALHALLADARNDLNAEQWSAFIYIGCEMFGAEAAREVVREALRVLEEPEEAA